VREVDRLGPWPWEHRHQKRRRESVTQLSAPPSVADGLFLRGAPVTVEVVGRGPCVVRLHEQGPGGGSKAARRHIEVVRIIESGRRIGIDEPDTDDIDVRADADQCPVVGESLTVLADLRDDTRYHLSRLLELLIKRHRHVSQVITGAQ
jgi:hypothetical protein